MCISGISESGVVSCEKPHANNLGLQSDWNCTLGPWVSWSKVCPLVEPGYRAPTSEVKMVKWNARVNLEDGNGDKRFFLLFNSAKQFIIYNLYSSFFWFLGECYRMFILNFGLTWEKSRSLRWRFPVSQHSESWGKSVKPCTRSEYIREHQDRHQTPGIPKYQYCKGLEF